MLMVLKKTCLIAAMQFISFGVLCSYGDLPAQVVDVQFKRTDVASVIAGGLFVGASGNYRYWDSGLNQWRVDSVNDNDLISAGAEKSASGAAIASVGTSGGDYSAYVSGEVLSWTSLGWGEADYAPESNLLAAWQMMGHHDDYSLSTRALFSNSAPPLGMQVARANIEPQKPSGSTKQSVDVKTTVMVSINCTKTGSVGYINTSTSHPFTIHPSEWDFRAFGLIVKGVRNGGSGWIVSESKHTYHTTSYYRPESFSDVFEDEQCVNYTVNNSGVLGGTANIGVTGSSGWSSPTTPIPFNSVGFVSLLAFVDGKETSDCN